MSAEPEAAGERHGPACICADSWETWRGGDGRGKLERCLEGIIFGVIRVGAVCVRRETGAVVRFVSLSGAAGDDFDSCPE